MFVLDTDVLSNLALQRPNPKIVEWIECEPAPKAIPFAAVIEIQRGITLLEARDPVRASAYDAWLEAILSSDMPFLPMDIPTARILAKMTCIPPLRHLWMSDLGAKKPKAGHDLAVAAAALANEAPVASLNIKDFLLIHSFFRLPGLFNPADMIWLVPPSAELNCTLTVA